MIRLDINCKSFPKKKKKMPGFVAFITAETFFSRLLEKAFCYSSEKN